MNKGVLIAAAVVVAAGGYWFYQQNSAPKMSDEMTIVSWGGAYSKSQLKAYSKKRFDPFCRRERLEIEINGHHLNH